MGWSIVSRSCFIVLFSSSVSLIKQNGSGLVFSFDYSGSQSFGSALTTAVPLFGWQSFLCTCAIVDNLYYTDMPPPKRQWWPCKLRVIFVHKFIRNGATADCKKLGLTSNNYKYVHIENHWWGKLQGLSLSLTSTWFDDIRVLWAYCLLFGSCTYQRINAPLPSPRHFIGDKVETCTN